MTYICNKWSGSSTLWMLLPALLVQCLLVPAAYGNYLTSPELAWSAPIVSSTTDANDPIFQKGNAIVPLDDYGLLAITSSTGTLHVVSASDVVAVNGTSQDVVVNLTGIKKSYTPTMINSNLDTTSCQGGIISKFKNSDGSFIVLYAITGSDSTSIFPPTSRILAINVATTKLVWNVTIPGTIVGTPVLSSTTDYMYVVHNVVPSSSSSGQDTTATSVGQVSIFKIDAASNIFESGSKRVPSLIITVPSTPTERPFGPATITIDPKDGREYLFFAESSDEFFEETFSGSLFAITENDDNEFLFLLATSGISSTNTAPTIRSSNDQLDFFLGQPESKLYGWVGDNAVELFDGLTTLVNGSSSTDVIPTWQIQSTQDRDVGSTPIPNSPLLSGNGTILYVTAAGPQILAMNLESRDLAWSSSDLNSVVLSKPVYDDQQTPVIYFMESVNSILRQFNAISGVSNWVAECGTAIVDGSNRPAGCGNVEADFAVVGNMLYYIDVIGNLVALKVAEFPVKPAPTPAPIAAPVTIPTSKPIVTPVAAPIALPVAAPSTPPSAQPNPATARPSIALENNPPTGNNETDAGNSTDEKSSQSRFGDNMLLVGISVGAAVLFLALFLGYCACRKYKREDKKGRTAFLRGRRATKVDFRNEETTVATTPVQSNDKSFDTPDNEKSFDIPDIEKSFDTQDIPPTPHSPLRSIEEVDDEADQHSWYDVEKNMEAPKVDDEKVVQNMLERFAVTSFDMEDDTEPRANGGDILSRGQSSPSINTMADAYSLASKKETDDAESLTGTLSVASKGSTRSIKDSIFSVLGMTAKADTDSLKSSTSGKSQSAQRAPIGQEIPSEGNIQRFQAVVSPAVSPRPDYSEPGMIIPGQANLLSPLVAPSSPSHSLLSNDESLYMDESTIATLEMPNTEDLSLLLQHDALASTASVSELPSDCPEDEVTNKLHPGLVYLNRHQAKKEQLDHPIRSSLLDDTRRVQPMYNGVSVRPASRSRAGIFSRRQPKLSATDDKIDDTLGIPEVTPEPIVLRTRRTLVAPSSPVADSQASLHSGSQTPPVRFTSAGYYTEEPEPDDSLLNDNSTVEGQSKISSEAESHCDEATTPVATKKDTWNSFLNELSKAENQFFNPTAAGKKGKSKTVDLQDSRKVQNTSLSSSSNGRPPVAAALPAPPPDIADGSESDEEETILPPPPAPRTFYA